MERICVSRFAPASGSLSDFRHGGCRRGERRAHVHAHAHAHALAYARAHTPTPANVNVLRERAA